LVNISTSDTDALVVGSVDLKIDCPTNFDGSPEILSAEITFLLTYCAEEGLIKKFSKFTTFGVTP
jgi:hypothetical protein